MHPAFRSLVPLLALAAPSSAQDPKPAPTLASDRAAALDRISADSLRGHLSFIASDLLEGRATPSRGLDIAAEYIAAQFRRAGLEPVGDDGYFQTAKWEVSEPDPAGALVEFRIGGEALRPPLTGLSVSAVGPIDLKDLPVVKAETAKAIADLPAEKVEGKALLVSMPDPRGVEPAKRAEAITNRNAVLAAIRAKKPALVLSLDREGSRGTGLGAGRLIDPEAPGGGFRLGPLGPAGPPTLTVHDPKAVAALEGEGEATVSFRLGEPVKRPVKLRNVVGVLRGSDPELKDTYVLVTAHYDHIGIGRPLKGDAIYNGANDDGSGTVSVIEIAQALATLKERPKRSIVFMTVFGEERGLLGSQHYGRHPIFPIEKTIADVNLEQVGRTDDSECPRVAGAAMTGFDYSDMGPVFAEAGKAEGVAITKHPRNSDAFFGRSDNQALADLGVPAHTLCVAFEFPDYHGAADHWDKIDYANMAKIDRAVARALLAIADSPDEPKWNDQNPRAARYLKAWKARRAGQKPAN